MDIWKFQKTLTRDLFIWAVLSLFSGGLLSLSPDPCKRGMGAQFKVWGLIDALIALFGTRSVKARRSRLPDPYYPQVLQEETRGLRDLLWINTALDLVYIAGGILLVLFRGRSESRWRGHGFGIIIQGAFLFLFDFRKARQLR